MPDTADLTPGPLTVEEQHHLRTVAASMIPASAELGLPGADDGPIFDEILDAAAPDRAGVREALRLLDETSGGDFAVLDAGSQTAMAEKFRIQHPNQFVLLVSIVVRCYYRDDRVMRWLGMDPRPPFPLGFELKQGDWSLLDPVRARPRLYREVP